MTVTKEQVIAVSKRYRVQSHYRASSDCGRRRYAIWHDGVQLIEPTTHGEAVKVSELLMAQDMIDLFGGRLDQDG